MLHPVRKWLLVLVTLVSCTSVQDSSGATLVPEYAVSATIDGRLRQVLLPQITHNPGKSGLRLIATGADAFLTRIAMIRLADHAIDLQYYSVHDDRTSRVLLEEVLRAADRGVKVRVLIDDLNIGEIGTLATVFNVHPNITIRSFNPVVTRHDPFWAHVTNYFTEFDRYTKRMHNKALIVDNQVAIMGGRNIGDNYFDASGDFNFSDMDVLVAGALTTKVSHEFDAYWNSKAAYPWERVTAKGPDNELIKKTRHELDVNWQKVAASNYGKPLKEMQPLDYLGHDKPLIWARADLVADNPAKVIREDEGFNSPPMDRLDKLLEHAQHEFIGVAPYLVPKDVGVKWLSELTQRGVSVKLLTNSLASTDVVPVHTAYKRYRVPMLKAGIELHEFKPIPGKRSRQSLLGSSSRASLHAKVYVIDRYDVIIGSFNLDPRSAELNTESAVIIHSAVIAQKIVDMFGEALSLDASYRLVDEENGLRWITEKKGQKVVYSRDPEPGVWRSLMNQAISLLPVENQM